MVGRGNLWLGGGGGKRALHSGQCRGTRHRIDCCLDL